MPKSISISFLLGFTFAPSVLHADGKVFSRSVAEVTIPDQQALIHWDEKSGTETLVIETRFTGEGDEFAWIVPLPSVPEISPATAGAFPTLRVLFMPRLEESTVFWSLGVVAIVIVIGLLVTRHFILALLAVLLPTIFIPSLSASRAGSVLLPFDAGAAQIHQRQIVGLYDVVTLSSPDGGSALSWLNENGFRLPDGVEPTLRDYAKEGWVFAAARLHKAGAKSQIHSGHPLTFRFPTKQPIYPMKLTGTGGTPLSLDLYVFGDRRAEVAGLEVVRCSAADCPKDTPRRPVLTGESDLRIRHPGLQAAIGAASVGTKLSGTLTPEQMKQDLRVSWQRAAHTGERKFTKGGALNLAVNLWVSLTAIGCLIVGIRLHVKRLTNRRALRQCLLVAVIVGLGCTATWAALPTVEATGTGPHPMFLAPFHRDLAANLIEEGDSLKSEPTSATLAASVIATIEKGSILNSYNGTAIRHEDSPGNFVIRSGKDGWEYVHFDAGGAEHVIPLGGIPKPNE